MQTIHNSRGRQSYRGRDRSVAGFLPVQAVYLVKLDVLPVQLIDESRLVVDKLIHFLQNSHM
jgi:hypothetical protein